MSDSDQKPNNRRKLFVILVLIALLILGWVVFAPGDDKKDANDNTKKTSQQDKKKEKDDGKVEAAKTDEPTTTPENPADGYVTTYTPPKVKTASTTPTVTTPPTTPVVPTPPTPEVPTPEVPGDNEEEPTCIAYEGQTITLKPGEVSDCYTLTSRTGEETCWEPEFLAYDDDGLVVNWWESGKELGNRPYIVIENAQVLVNESDEIACPHLGNELQFHVYAPGDATSTPQPENITYDHVLLVDDTNGEAWPQEVYVNIDDEPETPPVEL